MTKKDALTIALETMTNEEAKTVITKMIDQLAKPHSTSDATKEKRKAATAQARIELVSQVAPILRKYLSTDMTAKELFEAAKNELPEDFTAPKVQNILIREMKNELVRTERKKGGDTYRLA